jgi:lysophospholipase L1-like esterase
MTINISENVTSIRTAVYGKEVRSAIANSIEEMNESVISLNNKVVQGIGIAESKNIASNSISYTHFNLNEANLFNPSTITDNKYVDGLGALVDNEKHYMSDYIEVSEYMSYTIGTVLANPGCWYDKDKKYLSKVSKEKEINGNLITKAPKGAFFIRINGAKGDKLPGGFYFLEGETSNGLYPSLELKDIKIKANNIDSNSIESRHFKDIELIKTNLFNKDTIKTSKIIDKYGVEISATENLWCSDYIKISPNVEYTLFKTLVTPGVWYDKNKQPIKMLTPSLNTPTITSPVNAVYIRFNGDSSCDPNTVMLIEGNEYPSEYLSFNSQRRFILNGLNITSNNVIGENTLGKKWGVLGDSISAVNDTSNIKYYDLISEDLGMTVYNGAKSGSGFCVSTSGTDEISARLDLLPADLDLVTIFAGTNDFGRNLETNKPFGVVGDTTQSTFCGTVDYTLKLIINKYPKAKILYILPLPRTNQNTPNHINKKLVDYVNAIKEICELNCIPTLDLFRNSNFFINNSEFLNIFMPDGLHPNDEGHKRLAPIISNYIKEHI